MTTYNPRQSAAELLHDIRTTRRLPDWFTDQPERIKTTVQAAIADNQAEKAVELLAETWPLLSEDVHDDVVHCLHECGIHLAQVLPTSLLLARAFRLGAGALRTRELHKLAAAQGMHELAVHRHRDDNPEATASALADLATTYYAQGRMHKVINCADEALETYGLHGDTAGFVRTLLHLGTLMIEVGRYDTAVKYLARADTVPGGLDDAVSLALCRALLSRAHRLCGNDHVADRHLNRALVLVLGTDDITAQQVGDVATGKQQCTLAVVAMVAEKVGTYETTDRIVAGRTGAGIGLHNCRTSGVGVD